MSADFSIIIDWHRQLQMNKGSRATLKRCKMLAEIYLHPAYVELCQMLKKRGDKVASIAGVLAHINADCHITNISIAQQMGVKKKGSDSEKITPIRFRRLLATDDRQQLLRLLPRIIKQIDGFDLIKFTRDLYFWNERTKSEWAFTYYVNVISTQEQPSTQGESA